VQPALDSKRATPGLQTIWRVRANEDGHFAGWLSPLKMLLSHSDVAPTSAEVHEPIQGVPIQMTSRAVTRGLTRRSIISRTKMDRRVNPRIKSGDGDDAGEWVNTTGTRYKRGGYVTPLGARGGSGTRGQWVIWHMSSAAPASKRSTVQ
jgi:hypothetical protein